MSDESQPAEAAKPNYGLSPDAAEQLTALWLDVLQQGRASVTRQFEHDDSMLVWTIGLMGAGVFYANNLLSSAPRGLRFLALAPWIVGILTSLAARVIGGRGLPAETAAYLNEVIAFKSKLVISKDMLSVLVAVVGSMVRIVNGAVQPGAYGGWRLRLSLASHVLAGTGVVTVVAVSFLGAPAAFLAIVVAIGIAAIVFLRALDAAKKAYARDVKAAAESMQKLSTSLKA